MKKICVITGSRAEYGILKPLLKKLKEDKDITLDVMATAMHMEEKYGYTYKIIERDGFDIKKKIPLNIKDTSKITVVKSISLLQIELSKYFSDNSYDMIVILGDRYEMLAVANVALIYNIPICHLHGGEKTLGNFDEYIRHAITKMSHLHLVAAEEFRNRVIQLGENPKRVITTGALGVENVLSNKLIAKEELEKTLKVKLDDYFVVLFHPVTLKSEDDLVLQIDELLSALKKREESFIFIGSNSDTGSDIIMKKIKEFVCEKNNRHIFSSLATVEYHSLIKYSNGLIGNSSSGLLEVPSLKKPTLNIGDRQKGRLRGESVVDVECKQDSILQGIEKMRSIDNFYNPYEKENSSELAYLAIKEVLNNNISVEKDFYDLGVIE